MPIRADANIGRRMPLYLVIGILAAGCGPTITANSPPIPTTLSSCNSHPVIQAAGLRWEVSRVRWAAGSIPIELGVPLSRLGGSEGDPAMSNIHSMTSGPPQPGHQFLILDVAMTNLTQAPFTFDSGGYTPVLYQIRDQTGAVYRSKSTLSSFTRASTMASQGFDSINPNETIKGAVVFDVPNGSYTYSMWLNTFVGRTLSAKVFLITHDCQPI